MSSSRSNRDLDNCSQSIKSGTSISTIDKKLDYYSQFTPSILHDTLISNIVNQFIDSDDDNDNEVHSINGYDNDCIIKPFYHSAHGVLVCLDISQFTKLSATLQIEEVEYVINQTFGVLIATVHCFGGDILKFAGDSFYAFWKFDDDASQEKEISMITVECCIKIREVFNEVMLSKYNIDIRICSEAGELTFYSVGCWKRYEYLFSGQPLFSCIEADKFTTKGDYVICSRLYSNIKDNLDASNFQLDIIDDVSFCCFKFPRQCEQLFNSILSVEDTEELLGTERDSMLQSKIYDKCSSRNYNPSQEDIARVESILLSQLEVFVHEKARESSKEKELKNSSILFVRILYNLSEKAENDDEVATKLQDCICAVSGILQENEAKLRQFIFDDKGLVLIVSVFASKTNFIKGLSLAEAAILTAMSIQNELRKTVSLEAVIGITKGVNYLGSMGWIGSRIEFSILGPVVNLSARLMCVGTAGDIVCDKVVFSRCSNMFNFERNKDLILKGFADPVENYRVLGRIDNNVIGSKEFLSKITTVLAKDIIKVIDFMFLPLAKGIELHNDVISIYLQQLMQAIDISFCCNPKYCIISDVTETGVLQCLVQLISISIRTLDIKAVKVIEVSCAIHDNLFAAIIKKYTDTLESPAQILQLSPEASKMITQLSSESYVTMPVKQQINNYVEITEQISKVFDELLVIAVHHCHRLDSIAIEVLRSLSARNVKAQFLLSHASSHHVVNVANTFSSIQTETSDCYLSMNLGGNCSKDDIARYLRVAMQSNGLSFSVSEHTLDIIADSTQGIASNFIQLIDSSISNAIAAENDFSFNSSNSSMSSEKFEAEVLKLSRYDDVVNYKYDSLAISSQKICKLCAILAINGVFNLNILHELVLNHFPELVSVESGTSKEMDLNSLLTLLLSTKFFSIHEQGEHDEVFLKFYMKKAHSLIYNFIPADLKQEYHIYIAKMLLKRNNSNENPKPSSIYDMGIQYLRGSSLQNALLCFYHYGEYLYSLGSQKESLRIFEKAYNICNILFQKKLNVDLNEIKYAAFDETFSVRFSLQEMHDLVEGSNLILRTMISTLIRLGHCLVSYDRTRASAMIYPQAIQIFMSARVNNSFKLDKTLMNVSEQIVTATTSDVNSVNSNRLLCCQLAGSDLKFVEKTTLLVREAQSNIENIKNNEPCLFGIFSDQLESLFPIVSGNLMSTIEPGYHLQKTGIDTMEKSEWNSLFSLCDNLLQNNSGEFGKHHYIRFINLKIWRLICQNKPSTLHQCLSLANEAYFLYKFNEHSIPMITDYGADRGLQSIAVGAVHSVMVGEIKDAFRYIDMLVNSLPKLSHFFSYALSAQQLALSLTLLGDYHGALELFTELRAKETSAPFSLFIKINIFLLEWLSHECDADKHSSIDEDEKLRCSNLEKIMSGSERIHAVPFEVSYRLIELFGIGYENVLATIYLLNALKVMKTLSSGMLSVEEVAAYKNSIKQLCNTGLNYLRVYVDDDNNDCNTDGYITVRVQSLWCKARILHMLYQISNELDEKTEYKSKITRTLESVDNIISTFFYGNDSLIELTNKYWKLVLVHQDQELLDYVTCRYERLVQELNDMSYQSPLTVNIIQRVISHINKRIAILYC